MNFTSDIKKEIISRSESRRKKKGGKNFSAQKAALSAFIRTSGELGIIDGTPTFFIVSETENVAEFFIALFEECFDVELSVSNATMDKMSGRDKLVLQCPIDESEWILRELGLLRRGSMEFKSGISSRFTGEQRSRLAYVKGAFLGGGSCTIPTETGKTGYHLEIVFSDKKHARQFAELLFEEEMIAKVIKRKETYVVYIKSKEVISDFLSAIGAENALRKFSELVDKRDESNRNNRAANCFSGNADKMAQAAVKQILAIEKLKASSVFSDVSEELKTLANLRCENPAMSLQELADELKVSKSCLNHRMRRLMELAEKHGENCKE